jgi:hypothetical protein
VLTPVAVKSLACAEDSLNAVMKVLRRLSFRGWIEIHRLPDGSVCYLLSRRAAVTLEIPQRKRKGLGHDAAIENLGLLGLCLKLDIRKRSADDFRKTFPQFCRRGLSANCYGASSDNKLLWMIIDHGGRADRLANKVLRAITLRERLPAFRELIEAGEFGIAVAVPTSTKAAEVEAALASSAPNRFVTVLVEVLPELPPFFLQRS